MSQTNTTSAQQIADLVRAELSRLAPQPYRLSVVVDGIRQEDDWWYVPVTPDRGGVRAHEYAELLTGAENALCEREGVKVLLIPTFVND